ncbi:MAG TPA: CSLREA domain-containing protein, partial [Phototrophicaceae bacterium]|nr:CSLREA domain-containing protein [Phototrophicaceae bacterium]
MYSRIRAKMHRFAIPLVVAFLLSAISFQAVTANEAPAVTPDFGQLPLSFVPNAGQTDAAVLFQVRSLGGTLFFARDEVVLAVSQPAPASASIFDKTERESAPPLTLRLRFTGANSAPEMSGINPLTGHVNFFYGNDPARWQSNVPTYGSVVYHQLYPGIDLRYDGQEGLLKGTFEVAPGAAPAVIGWQYDGAQSVTIDTATGDLQITLPNGNVLAERAPTAWQDINGARVPVAIAYTLGADGRIGFTLGNYDSAYALQLDPTLEYSTYLGGSGADYGKTVIGDMGYGIYVTGSTESSDFPLSNNPFQGSNAGGKDVFVAKISAGGTGLEFATYIGGSGTDDVMDMGVPGLDRDCIFLVGRTTSSDFPVVNSTGSTLKGPSDAFVLDLNLDGSGLAYSSYLGGSGNDFAVGLTPGQTSDVTITGVTDSTDFPTTPEAFQPAYGGGQWDIFMVGRWEPEDGPMFSTYFGGSGRDIVTDIDWRAITGSTTSPDFPLANPTDATYSHPGCDTAQSSCEDAFVAVIEFDDGSPSFSTYLGGSGQEERGLGVTSSMYVTGYTSSADFPTLNPFQAVMPNTNRTAFVTKFSGDINYNYQLAYSTYLGGSGQDMGTDVVVNTSGSVYVAGVTSSANFPLVNPLQPALASTQDAFISELSPDGTQLLFSTYLGGNGDEYAEFSPSLTLDPYSRTDRLLVTGTTYSTDFPTVNALQPTPGGGGSSTYANVDAFLALIDLGTHFVVNTMDDLDDGACTATHCSLREAIKGANAIIGLDKILFNLPGSGPYTIQPTSALPAITDQVILDGSTQPAYAGKPVVEINGSQAGVANGLWITGTGTHVSNIVINGFNGAGVLFSEGNTNLLSHCYIGTDLTGTIKRGNQIGVKFLNTANNSIGEGMQGGCLISGNLGDGVYLEGSGTTNNAIHYNSIGLSATGQLLGNGGNGVRVSSTAGSNKIRDNKIAGNGLNGVVVESGSTNPTGVEIVSNFIYGNGLLGIDLGGDGVTLNDTGDTDTGPNNRQNYPIINSIQTTASTIVINGSLNSAPNTRYIVDIFSSTSCDASGYGEGEVFLRGIVVDTDATGIGTFSQTLNQTVPAGTAITTLASQNMAGHTSEFSPCRVVSDSTAGAVFNVNTTNDVNDGQCTTTHCSLREAITAANARSGADTINGSQAGVANGLWITGTGTHVSNIVINGFNGAGVLFS